MGKCMNNKNRKLRRKVSDNNNTKSFIRVRTRARTLALRINLILGSSTSQLQLRRRRRIHSRSPPSPKVGELHRNPEFEVQQRNRNRTTRESSPCNAVRDLANITKETPRLSLMLETNPTRQEIEAFFYAAECRQQQLFNHKYNFDFLNEKPLPGRFEWEKLIA